MYRPIAEGALRPRSQSQSRSRRSSGATTKPGPPPLLPLARSRPSSSQGSGDAEALPAVRTVTDSGLGTVQILSSLNGYASATASPQGSMYGNAAFSTTPYATARAVTGSANALATMRVVAYIASFLPQPTSIAIGSQKDFNSMPPSDQAAVGVVRGKGCDGDGAEGSTTASSLVGQPRERRRSHRTRRSSGNNALLAKVIDPVLSGQWSPRSLTLGSPLTEGSHSSPPRYTLRHFPHRFAVTTITLSDHLLLTVYLTAYVCLITAGGPVMDAERVLVGR